MLGSLLQRAKLTRQAKTASGERCAEQAAAEAAEAANDEDPRSKDIEYEDSSDEYQADEDEMTSSEEDQEGGEEEDELTKKRGKTYDTLTDDEEEDDDRKRNLRRRNKAKLHALIDAVKGEEEGARKSSKYKPDERSEKMARKFIKSTLMKKAPMWIKFGKTESQEVQDQVAQGIFPKKCKSLPQTPVLTYSGLERVLGYIQEHEIEAGREDNLVDGSSLQLWQFFAFGEDKYFALYRPKDFNDHIIAKFKYPSVALHGLAGYKALLQGISIFQNKFSHSVSVLYLYSQVSMTAWTVLKVFKT